MFKISLKYCICTIGVYATCFSLTGPSSGNTSFKGVYCTVHLVKLYSLGHVVVVINFDDVHVFFLFFICPLGCAALSVCASSVAL
jgi:hypothetical protein